MEAKKVCEGVLTAVVGRDVRITGDINKLE